MKKKTFILLIILIFNIENVMAKKIDCTQFEKISAKYLECKVINLKAESKVLTLKANMETVKLKKKIATTAINNKKKFNKSTLKEMFIKFKNSKTLTNFMEK